MPVSGWRRSGLFVPVQCLHGLLPCLRARCHGPHPRGDMIFACHLSLVDRYGMPEHVVSGLGDRPERNAAVQPLGMQSQMPDEQIFTVVET
ncbi:hypothetical protein B0H66DRAFT_564997 [Apodospora peruviana]|uniref:Uncharacterized protein n=1 Tax=Apodospora peruviana TaxID=516989 RepID=A0AAE0HYT0_9PEZI|nr:hypothetical protein B0H66DRAFT_564997 [Apodospora peruviana]